MNKYNLFDIETTPQDRPHFTRSQFNFLNTSTKEGVPHIRKLLQDWFSHYPENERSEFLTRFRSNLDHQHNASFFELFIHELLSRHGYNVQVHPKIENRIKSPDFLASAEKLGSVYLEAAVATYMSAKELATETRLNQFYDGLNKLINSPNFFVFVEIINEPSSPLPIKKVARIINEELAKQRLDEINDSYVSGKFGDLPKIEFEHKGCKLVFGFFPKSPKMRGKAGVRPLAAFSYGLRSVNHRIPLREAIAKKVSRYGNLNMPYVVAINTLEAIDEIDVMEALFGKEVFQITIPHNSESVDEPPRFFRERDGIWTSNRGPINRRLSAVLLARRLYPWTIESADIKIYQNPWATHSISNFLHRLPYASVDSETNRIVQHGGETLTSILEMSNKK